MAQHGLSTISALSQHDLSTESAQSLHGLSTKISTMVLIASVANGEAAEVDSLSVHSLSN